MSCLGVLFAMPKKDVDALLVSKYDEDRLEYLQHGIEEDYLDFDSPVLKYAAELDKSWDAIHRVMTDGSFGFDNGAFPLNHVIMGGESLYHKNDYYMILKTPEQVKAIWNALKIITESWFRERYFQIDPYDYGHDVDEEDYLYTWEWFNSSLPVWERAAREDRYMLFTVDQ